MRYIDIRTNIIDSQKKQALDLAHKQGVSLSEVVRDSPRAYLASAARQQQQHDTKR